MWFTATKCFAILLLVSACTKAQPPNPSIRGQFIQFSVATPENRIHAVEWIDDHWQPGFEAMAIEALGFAGDRESKIEMIALLQRKTGKKFGDDINAWQHWLWQHAPRPHSAYADVKASLYAMVDVNYRAYFRNSPPTTVRLDEVQWIGLRRSDELPVLTQPEMVDSEQSQLDGEQLVYGLQLGDQTRAYTRALVAHHGVVRDKIGDQSLMLVFDTLTGSAAAYFLDEDTPDLASSGFLHRGDTLLYDKATQSLWSSLRGRPVVGTLASENIQLTQVPAVTSSWEEWRRRHPKSQVTADDPAQQSYLIDQANYRKFVAKDRINITSSADQEATPQSRVLGLTHEKAALAIPLNTLQNNEISQHPLGDDVVVVITGSNGGSRAYLSTGVEITKLLENDRVRDSDGQLWTITEDALRHNNGKTLHRIPARRAHWAAWRGAYPDSNLALP